MTIQVYLPAAKIRRGRGVVSERRAAAPLNVPTTRREPDYAFDGYAYASGSAVCRSIAVNYKSVTDDPVNSTFTPRPVWVVHRVSIGWAASVDLLGGLRPARWDSADDQHPTRPTRRDCLGGVPCRRRPQFRAVACSWTRLIGLVHGRVLILYSGYAPLDLRFRSIAAMSTRGRCSIHTRRTIGGSGDRRGAGIAGPLCRPRTAERSLFDSSRSAHYRLRTGHPRRVVPARHFHRIEAQHDLRGRPAEQPLRESPVRPAHVPGEQRGERREPLVRLDRHPSRGPGRHDTAASPPPPRTHNVARARAPARASSTAGWRTRARLRDARTRARRRRASPRAPRTRAATGSPPRRGTRQSDRGRTSPRRAPSRVACPKANQTRRSPSRFTFPEHAQPCHVQRRA